MSDQKKSFGPPPPPSLKYVSGVPGAAILSWPIVRGLSSYTVQTHVRLDVAQPRSRGSLLLVMIMSQERRTLGPGKIGGSLRSKRFRASSSRTSGREKKKGMTGEGEGKEGTNFRAITRLETSRRLNWRSLKWDCRLVESNNREVRRYLFKANFLLTVLTQEEP